LQTRLLLALLLVPLLPASASANEPWTLDEALLPERVSLRITHRARYESLDDPFRAGQTEDAEGLMLRTLVHGQLRLFDEIRVGAELIDARAYYTDATPLDTTIVDSVELLRAYLDLTLPGVLGGSLHAQAGRLTLDVGSRRFVARNRFRNTINAFTGIDLDWTGSGPREGRELRAFWTLPVQRLPSDADALGRNAIEFDAESLDVQLWGLFGATDLPDLGRLELFVFGLHERDGPDRPTRNRQLYTPGFRWWLAAEPGQLDVTFESALQFGHARASASATEDLDVFGYFVHAELGYTFDALCRPRVAIQYDLASGDDDPDDEDYGRFDTLYGARRFDFGPTGIYGPFARANLHTPGVRVQVQPHPTLTSFAAVRGFWLASARDAWTTAGIQDPSGSPGPTSARRSRSAAAGRSCPATRRSRPAMPTSSRAGSSSRRRCRTDTTTRTTPTRRSPSRSDARAQRRVTSSRSPTRRVPARPTVM